MIYYDATGCGVAFIFRRAGSVFPKAAAWSVPAAATAVLLNIHFSGDLATDGAATMWAGYTAVLGFLMVFRNNQAYNRFWEGAALTQQVRGEWLNAVSSLMAFCSLDETRLGDTVRFKHFVVRLMSMLHCAALQQIACVSDDRFEIISPEGICKESLQYLSCHSPETRCEIVLLWIQQLIVAAHAEGTLSVAPPVLTRAFQELSRGIVTLHDAQRIKEVPFPFPYSQLITTMLLVHTIATPVLASQVAGGPWWSGAVTFCIVSAFWSLLYIALDIEQPFGEDSNKLPVADMQRSMNKRLSLFLDEELRSTPAFKYSTRCDLIRFEKSTTKIVRGFGSTETLEEGEDIERIEDNELRRKALKPGFTFKNKSGSFASLAASPSFGSGGVCSMSDVVDGLGADALEAIRRRTLGDLKGGKASVRHHPSLWSRGSESSRSSVASSIAEKCGPLRKKLRFKAASSVIVLVSGKPSPKVPPPAESPHEVEPPDEDDLSSIFPSHRHRSTILPVVTPEEEEEDEDEIPTADPFRHGSADTMGNKDASGTASVAPASPSPMLPPGSPEELFPSHPGQVC